MCCFAMTLNIALLRRPREGGRFQRIVLLLQVFLFLIGLASECQKRVRGYPMPGHMRPGLPQQCETSQRIVTVSWANK